jgi:hydroxypyruvate isomerase
MPRFAANLSMMFNEVPFLDRFKAASQAGFTAVEFLFPYEHSPEEVESKAKAAGTEVVLFNMPAGNWGAGERGITGLPGREEEFREGVDKALVYAERLGTPRLHAMAGIAPAGANISACRATLVANLKYAAEKLAAKNITLLL